MRNFDDWFLGALVLAPALFGVAALVGSILLYRSATPAARDRVPRIVASVVLLVFFLGVAACYGMIFTH